MKTKGSVVLFRIVLVGTAALLVCICFYFLLSTDKQLPSNGSAERSIQRDAPVNGAQPLATKTEIGAVSDVSPAPRKEVADEKSLWPQAVIKQNKARVETELANLELAIANKVPFDFVDRFLSLNVRCEERFKHGVSKKSVQKRYEEILAAGIVLDTQQARESFIYSSGFYDLLCEAIGPITSSRLSARLKEHRQYWRQFSENSPKPDFTSLLTALYNSPSREEVTKALYKLSEHEHRFTLWRQDFMRAGHSMPAKFDRIDSATLGLVGAFFVCKTSPDECMPGTFTTIDMCRMSFTCAPGLGVYDYAAMLHSSARIEAANQIADALIAQRKAISTLGRRN